MTSGNKGVRKLIKGGAQQQCAILSFKSFWTPGTGIGLCYYNITPPRTSFCIDLADGLFQMANHTPQTVMKKHAAAGMYKHVGYTTLLHDAYVDLDVKVCELDVKVCDTDLAHS